MLWRWCVDCSRPWTTSVRGDARPCPFCGGRLIDAQDLAWPEEEE